MVRRLYETLQLLHHLVVIPLPNFFWQSFDIEQREERERRGRWG